ncbi:MAG: hypothetical protein O2807_12385, partial [bacterium]|nr:hypothetical protein [bacterium]
MSRERFDSNTPVLLAESDPAVQEIFKPIFEDYQFANVTVEEEAYGVLRADDSNSYGLIVLGSSLEGMSVSKVVAALRSGGRNTGTPILLMYNLKDEAIVDKVMEAGATVSLQWPVKKDVFRKTLEDLLDKRIVSKGDEKELVHNYRSVFSGAADRVKNLRWEGKIEEAEAAFPEVLPEFFLCVAELYYAREDHDSANRIIDEGKKIFPGLEDEFWRRIGKESAENSEKVSDGEEGLPDASEKIDPGIPVLVAAGDATYLETC